MLCVKDLNKSYEGQEILKEIGLYVEKGEFVVIMGRSGCGKSTLLYCISGMDQVSSGEIVFDGKKLSQMDEKAMEELRLHRMGFIFQRTNFLKNLSIEDNIVFPAYQLGGNRHRIVKEAEDLMTDMNIEDIAAHDIRKVSGGQLQRAAICRAIINHPDILFGDEPTGALNSTAAMEVMNILNDINQRRHMSILLVTHDTKVAARADRVIYLEDGQIKEECKLGRYIKEQQSVREEQLQKWLKKMNF